LSDDGYATHQDISSVSSQIESDIGTISSEITGIVSTVSSDITSTVSSVSSQIGGGLTSLSGDVEAVKTNVDSLNSRILAISSLYNSQNWDNLTLGNVRDILKLMVSALITAESPAEE
jgi:phage-related protein